MAKKEKNFKKAEEAFQFLVDVGMITPQKGYKLAQADSYALKGDIERVDKDDPKKKEDVEGIVCRVDFILLKDE